MQLARNLSCMAFVNRKIALDILAHRFLPGCYFNFRIQITNNEMFVLATFSFSIYPFGGSKCHGDCAKGRYENAGHYHAGRNGY